MVGISDEKTIEEQLTPKTANFRPARSFWLGVFS